MNCSWCEERFERLLDGLLNAAETARLRAHVDACAACSGLLEELRVVDALLDVGRLLLHADHGAAGQVVEPVLGVGVADLLDRVADDGLEVDVRLRRYLTEHQDQPGRGGSLAGDAGIRIFGQDGVQDRVGDLVAHLVGVALGHRLGREQVLGVVENAGHRSPGAPFGRSRWWSPLVQGEA